MRFITEFEITPDELKYANNPIKGHRKSCAEERLGGLIAETFGWQERGETTLHGPVKERHSLEIEAFPMEKWIEFKQKLFTHVYEEGRQGVAFNQVRILELIKELESFGKPAGDTKQI